MPKSKKEFYLFRHGETDWNRIGRMQGAADIPLNQLGIAQAESLRAFFDGRCGEVVSSPLSRALNTAVIALRISEETAVTVRTEARLAETHLGQAEGLTHEELIGNFGEDVWNGWVSLGKESWHAKFPDGETKGEVRDRALEALLDLAKEPHDVFFIATHGGLLRRLLHHFHPEEILPIEVGNGYVFKFVFEEDKWIVDKAPVFIPG